MASSVTIRTQPITRNKLARLTDNPELIRLLENLVLDVTVNIPAATDTLQTDSGGNTEAIDAVRVTATAALGLANAANEGPPATVVVLPDIPEDHGARLAALEARLAGAERQIAQMKEGPNP